MAYKLNNALLVENPDLKRDILIIGCGGTGGFVAEGLCRLLAKKRKRVILMDDDIVEPENLVRQNFYDCDLGKFKSQVLAERLARKTGCLTAYATCRFTGHNFSPTRSVPLVIGCVDSGPSRADILQFKNLFPAGAWWIDAGNGNNWGQVLIGNSIDPKPRSSFNPETMTCNLLPVPALQQPGILAGRPTTDVACAEAVEQNLQSPLINQAMAVLVLEVVRQLIAGTLTWMQLYINLEHGTMRFVEASPENVAKMLHVTVKSLTAKPKKEGSR